MHGCDQKINPTTTDPTTHHFFTLHQASLDASKFREVLQVELKTCGLNVFRILTAVDVLAPALNGAITPYNPLVNDHMAGWNIPHFLIGKSHRLNPGTPFSSQRTVRFGV